MSNKVLHTKFGNAKVTCKGYYEITTRKEGNYKKRLHRLIYEDYHKLCILPGNIVHHIDGNKLNNDISNLQLVSWGEHTKIHHTNKKISEEQKKAISIANKGRRPSLGKKHSEESKKKMSEAQKGRIFTKEHKINCSKARNTTGYYRVSKQKDKKFSQGFRWRYSYLENGKLKEIKSIDLDKLKKKVLAKGLEWIEFANEDLDDN